jgi:FkbM family methyltransferase
METDQLAHRIDVIERKLERMWNVLESISGRLSNYLGDGVSATYLKNGDMIYVNSNDYGTSADYIDGGEYEPDNLQALFSFLKADTVFLDIGANLGFFSLLVGDRLRRCGKVIAFEPQPNLAELFRRSVYRNQLLDIVTIHPFGLSETPGRFPLWIPKTFRGGARLGEMPEAIRGDFEEISVETRRLDDLVGPEFVCDLVKIDVEGHELSVLNGMRGVVGRSPDIKLLIEKLGRHTGVEPHLLNYFADFGMAIYAVSGPALEGPLDLEGLRNAHGYVLAARPASIDGLDRRRFSIFPVQMLSASARIEQGRLVAEGPGLLAHGPYWSLPKGIWRLTIEGESRGAIRCVIAERFGYEVTSAPISAADRTADFVVERDLTRFECAFWGEAGARLEIERLDWRRIG